MKKSNAGSHASIPSVKTRLLDAAILATLVLAICAPTFDWPFRNDDYPQLLMVQENGPSELFVRGQKDLHLKRHGWDQGQTSAYYRPVDQLTWWINWHLFGWNVGGYHLTNALIHFLAALGCYAIAARMYASRFAGLAAGLLMTFSLAAVAPLFGHSIDNRTDSLFVGPWWSGPCIFGSAAGGPT